MTEISMRVARALCKRNFVKQNISVEKVALVVDEIANIPLILDVLSKMDAIEFIDIVTSRAAKNAGTF